MPFSFSKDGRPGPRRDRAPALRANRRQRYRDPRGGYLDGRGSLATMRRVLASWRVPQGRGEFVDTRVGMCDDLSLHVVDGRAAEV